jgi:hypothetical protein
LRKIFAKLLKEERKSRKIVEALANEKTLFKKSMTVQLMQDRHNLPEDAF